MNVCSAVRFALILLFVGISNESSLNRHRESPDVKIIGGRPAEIWEFPYQVSIQDLDYHNCGGSIIAPKYILTAAHCFGDDVLLNETTVRAGSSVVLKGGNLVKIKKINSHPKYSLSTDYDISILELEEALTYSRNIKAVELPLSNSVFENSVGTVTGWGVTETGSESTQLMTVDVPIIPHEECVEDYAGLGISIRQLCAGVKQGGKDSCGGDSGGPLTVKGVQAGIVSAGAGCGEANKPGIYTSVAESEIRNFIKEISGV